MITPAKHAKVDRRSSEGTRLPLTNGRYALLDYEDFLRLSGGRWMTNTVHGKTLAYRRATSGPATCIMRGKNRKNPARLRPRVYLHREVLGLARGDTRRVYFRNGDTLDCRRSNLEIRTGGSVLETREVKRKPFKALVFIKGRPVHLGFWPTREMAEAVRELVAPLGHELRASGLSHAKIKRRLQQAAGIR